jgi:D-alanyl-D-alanine carboxypeptidase
MHIFPNTNEALEHLPGLIASKTGYTDLAGGNLAIVFDKGIGHHFVAVVLGSSRQGRFSDMRALMEAVRGTDS